MGKRLFMTHRRCPSNRKKRKKKKRKMQTKRKKKENNKEKNNKKQHPHPEMHRWHTTKRREVRENKLFSCEIYQG